MFFSEVEGHMQKLSSFGQGKKIRPKSYLHGSSTQPFKNITLLGMNCFVIATVTYTRYVWHQTSPVLASG